MGTTVCPRLQQTLQDLENDFERVPDRIAALAQAPHGGDGHTEMDRIVFLKAVVNGKIIGSIRGYAMGDTAYLRRMIVHPYFRRRGIGRRLLKEIENAFPEVKRFEAKTGHQSKRNLFQLARSGYQVFRTEPFTPNINWVYLQKERRASPAHSQHEEREMSSTTEQTFETNPSRGAPGQGRAGCARRATGWCRSAPRGCRSTSS